MNTEAASFLSAGAAVLAAVFTGFNLWLTGRRHHVSWTRQALEKACVDFLTAHYEHWDACSRLEVHKDAHDHSRADRDARERIVEADATMMRCVTRFRVLTSPALARAALDLREFNRMRLRSVDALASAQDVPNAVTEDRAREKQRDRFVLIVQQVLQIGAKGRP